MGPLVVRVMLAAEGQVNYLGGRGEGTYRLKVKASWRYARDTESRRRWIDGVCISSSRAGWKLRAWLDTRAGSGALGGLPVSHNSSTKQLHLIL